MIGLVVASHGHLAQELLATAEQIVGPLHQTIACSVEPGASPEEIKRGLRESIERVDSGEGVLVFADLIGGTPCTTSLSFCKARALEVLTGVNLPMLLKANALRSKTPVLKDLAHGLTEYGKKSITCATDGLRVV